jgi:hypothetical protein
MKTKRQQQGSWLHTNVIPVLVVAWGSRWRSWFRQCATSQKVAGSIGIFHRHDPSDRNIALGSTQPQTYMSTRNISWG